MTRPRPQKLARLSPSRSRLAALLALVASSLPAAPLWAADLLKSGQWKGDFTPANLGDDIDATYCIHLDTTGSGPWKVTMHLDLPPPGNDPVVFEFMESEEESLRFRINLLGALRECLLEKKYEDELTFSCKLVDNDSDNTDKLTMRRAEPQPDDECQPNATADND